MNKKEMTDLAKSCSAAIDVASDGYIAIFTSAELLAFANACEKAGMEKAGDMLSLALQSDLEHGVKWLNEQTAKYFRTVYPELSKTIGEINRSEEVE